jgi:hypothetical protein
MSLSLFVEVALACENDHFPYAKASDVHSLLVTISKSMPVFVQ